MIGVLVGGQFGSEGKGAIAGHIAQRFGIHVRVGAANAGHTVYTSRSYAQGGEETPEDKHVMQQLPCAAYTNPVARCVLGAGAMISPEIFLEELRLNAEWRERMGYAPLKVFIDHRAHIVCSNHIEAEQATDLAERIGSTSTLAREGIGAAQAARALRHDYLNVREALEYSGMVREWPIKVVDTVRLLHEAAPFENILLEGTQGTSLCNTTGFYPYVTSRNVSAAGIVADTGLAPGSVGPVIMVCRTFPIRVAGNSGPFWDDSREVKWKDLGIDQERERTTVTKKVRRVATMSYDQLKYNAQVNGATEIALTFADYVDPSLAGQTGQWDTATLKRTDIYPMVYEIEKRTGIRVSMIGTGPHSVIEVIDAV